MANLWHEKRGRKKSEVWYGYSESIYVDPFRCFVITLLESWNFKEYIYNFAIKQNYSKTVEKNKSISSKSIKLLLDFKAKEFSCLFILATPLLLILVFFQNLAHLLCWSLNGLDIISNCLIIFPFFILLILLLLEKKLINWKMESLILCNQHSCSNSAFFMFCPGKTLFCALEGKMIPFLQLLHSSGLWLLTRAYCPLSLQLCVSSPVEIRLHHKMET